MTPQVWVVLIAFIIQIIYSIVLAGISKEFREITFKNKVSMGIYYFMTIITLGILLIYGTKCSISGSAYDSSCELFGWILAILVSFVILFTIFRSYLMIYYKNTVQKTST